MKKNILISLSLMCALALPGYAQVVRSATVGFRYCVPDTTYLPLTVVPPQLPYTYNGVTFTEAGTQEAMLINSRDCDSVVVMTLAVAEQPGSVLPFSVSELRKVFFAPGNLQYLATKGGQQGDTTHVVIYPEYQSSTVTYGVYRFAEHQWDALGDCTANQQIPTVYGPTSTYWIDIFSSSSVNDSETGIWMHAISNDNHDNDYQWDVLSSSEWSYLLGTSSPSRANAANLYCYATVNGMPGLVILPDAWQTPNAVALVFGTKDFGSNVFVNDSTQNDWYKMEAAGAAFLPAQYKGESMWSYSGESPMGGAMNGAECIKKGLVPGGEYLTTNHYCTQSGYGGWLCFTPQKLSSSVWIEDHYNSSKWFAFPVRLVREAPRQP